MKAHFYTQSYQEHARLHFHILIETLPWLQLLRTWILHSAMSSIIFHIPLATLKWNCLIFHWDWFSGNLTVFTSILEQYRHWLQGTGYHSNRHNMVLLGLFMTEILHTIYNSQHTQEQQDYLEQVDFITNHIQERICRGMHCR